MQSSGPLACSTSVICSEKTKAHSMRSGECSWWEKPILCYASCGFSCSDWSFRTLSCRSIQVLATDVRRHGQWHMGHLRWIADNSWASTSLWLSMSLVTPSWSVSHMVLDVFSVWTDLKYYYPFWASCQNIDSHGDSGDFSMKDYHLHTSRIMQQTPDFIMFNNLLEKIVMSLYLFIWSLFNDTISSLDYVASDDRIVIWKGCGRKFSWPSLTL
jgi:hypothetical protein